MKICEADDCTRESKTRLGFCVMHYKRFMRNSTTERVLRQYENDAVCETSWCNNTGKLRNGLCNGCRVRVSRNNTTDMRRQPSGCGSINSGGYILITVDGQRVYEHRHLMEKHLGRKLTPSEVIHHIDNNPQNNSIDNLQIMTQAEHASLHHAMRRSDD